MKKPMQLFRSRSFVCGGALCLALVVPSPSWAQGVFKCTVGGKTVYQSTACTGQGKELEIAPGPSEQQIQEAKTRADAEKARVNAYQQAEPAAAPRREDQPMGRKADCAKLNQERAEAFGRRNATVRSSRESNIDKSASVNQDHDTIRRIESQMVKGGCKPT